MKASVFPGQGSQFVGMGVDLLEHDLGKAKLLEANDILGFDIKAIMKDGDEDALRSTDVTQPAVFLHSVIRASLADEMEIHGVAGHSLGEISAMVVAGVLTFSEGLRLVSVRAKAMQRACEEHPGTMAAIVGLEDEVVEKVCLEVDGIVVAANYNCPGQLVISGEHSAIESACLLLKERGAKRALPLQVGGAFHSPLMEDAQQELGQAIAQATFNTPTCPIYQNVDGVAHTDVDDLKTNLLKQLTSPVRWTQTINNMIAEGIDEFVEVGGNGKVIRGMIRRINREVGCVAI